MPLIEFEVSLPSKLSTADLQKLKLVPYTDGELNVTKMVLEKRKWLIKIFFSLKIGTNQFAVKRLLVANSSWGFL